MMTLEPARMWPLNGLRFSATLSGQYVAAARKSHSATLAYHRSVQVAQHGIETFSIL